MFSSIYRRAAYDRRRRIVGGGEGWRKRLGAATFILDEALQRFPWYPPLAAQPDTG